MKRCLWISQVENLVYVLIVMLYIPFHSGRNGRKISYRHANQYEAPHVPPRPKFRPVSAGICNLAEILFWVFFSLLSFSAPSSSSSSSYSASKKWSLVMGLWTWSLKKKEIFVGEDGEERKKKEFKEKRNFGG